MDSTYQMEGVTIFRVGTSEYMLVGVRPQSIHCKKGIVILTSELLFEFQMRKPSEARAKCLHILVALPDQECGNALYITLKVI